MLQYILKDNCGWKDCEEVRNDAIDNVLNLMKSVAVEASRICGDALDSLILRKGSLYLSDNDSGEISVNSVDGMDSTLRFDECLMKSNATKYSIGIVIRVGTASAVSGGIDMHLYGSLRGV